MNKQKNKEENNPLEILLGLLEREKLNITNFSLAQITDDYLEFLTNLREQDDVLGNISEFLWVASKLALLKSKVLVSTFNFEEELENELETDGELKERLIEYKKFREISKLIGSKFLDNKELIARKNKLIPQKDFSISFKIEDLKEIFRQIVIDFKIEHKIVYQKKEIKESIKIKEKIEEIKKLLKTAGSFKFSRIIFKKNSRSELVISFLSVLELVKQGAVCVNQEECFKDFEVINQEKHYEN